MIQHHRHIIIIIFIIIIIIIIIVSSLHAGRRSGSDKLSAELQQARHPALKNAPMEGGYALNKNMAVCE